MPFNMSNSFAVIKLPADSMSAYHAEQIVKAVSRIPARERSYAVKMGRFERFQRLADYYFSTDTGVGTSFEALGFSSGAKQVCRTSNTGGKPTFQASEVYPVLFWNPEEIKEGRKTKEFILLCPTDYKGRCTPPLDGERITSALGAREIEAGLEAPALRSQALIFTLPQEKIEMPVDFDPMSYLPPCLPLPKQPAPFSGGPVKSNTAIMALYEHDVEQHLRPMPLSVEARKMRDRHPCGL